MDMTRIARAVATDFPHHVTQRGNNRENIFHDNQDKEQYLTLLKKYSEKWECSILGYCVMDNHVHLLNRPSQEYSLSKMMQGLTLAYSKYANKKYMRTGRLWECRYFSNIVEKESYLWTVLRYIEQNPCRAKMVKKAEDYPYSSARAHIWSDSNPLLKENLFDEYERTEYRKFLDDRPKENDLDKIRFASRTGRPLGTNDFVIKMERRLKRRFIPKAPGRPKGKG